MWKPHRVRFFLPFYLSMQLDNYDTKRNRNLMNSSDVFSIIMFSGIPFNNKSEITLSYLFRSIDNMIHVYTTNL